MLYSLLRSKTVLCTPRARVQARTSRLSLSLLAALLLVGSLTGFVTSAAQMDSELWQAQAALAQGRLQEALQQLQRLAVARPGSAAVALWLGHALRRQGDLPAATREYLRGLSLEPASAEIRIALGDLQQSGGELAEAAKHYKKAIEVAPASPDGYRRAAAVEVERENHSEAIRYLRSYLRIRPHDLEALAISGLAHYYSRDSETAIRTFERVMQIDPNHLQAHFGLGLALADRDPGRSLNHLRRALAVDEANPTSHYTVGRVLASQGRPVEALVALERSLELSPDFAEAHYQIALVHARLGNNEAARTHQRHFNTLNRQAIELEGWRTRLEALRNLTGDVRRETDEAQPTHNTQPEHSQLDPAIQSRRQALEGLLRSLPPDAEVLTLAARAWMALGAAEQALAAVERVLQNTPDNGEAWFVRGLVLHRSGRDEQARQALQRSLQTNPLAEQTHGLLGDVLMALDQPEAAVEAYGKAQNLDPDNPTQRLQLAVAYKRLGLSDLEAEAMANYRLLIARDSGR